MSAWDKAREGLKIGDMLITGVEAIQVITQIGGPPASEVLVAVQAIIKTLLDGVSGATSPEVVLAEITATADRHAINNAAADKAIDARFDQSK